MIRTLTFLMALAVVTSASAQTNPMRAGRWEVTMQMDMPNMPVQMPAMKNTRCVTQQEIESPNRGLPTGPDKNPNNCKMSDYKVSGNTVTWSMACTGQPATTGTGEMRFTGDAYEGLMKMTMDQRQMSMKISGKRLGDCAP
jgi:hypothetical protein